MPIRKKAAPPLQTPEEIAKEKKMTSTCAMGMKMTLASNECWKTQVNSEQRIATEWKKTYQPDYAAEEAAALQRTQLMETLRREERDANPHRHLLLDGHSLEGKGRKQYLAERLKLDPQDKQGAPLTASQTVGWDAARTGAAAVGCPLATQRHLYHTNATRVGAPGGSGAAGPMSLQNSSAIAGSMGTAASHGKPAAGGGYDLLSSVQSITYDGKGGACEIVRQ